jgi:hypothetical protein
MDRFGLNPKTKKLNTIYLVLEVIDNEIKKGAEAPFYLVN